VANGDCGEAGPAAHDFDSDPRFTKLPQRFIDELATIKPTGLANGDTWHEVQFDMGGIMCQAAVINGKYIPLNEAETSQFVAIIKVWQEEELSI